MSQLRISGKSSKQLSELSQQRKDKDEPVNTKKGIAAELIDKAHKREVKS